MALFVFKLTLVRQLLPFAAPAKPIILTSCLLAQGGRGDNIDQTSFGPGFLFFENLYKNSVPRDTTVHKYGKAIGFGLTLSPKGKVNDVKFVGFSFFNGHFILYLMVING